MKNKIYNQCIVFKSYVFHSHGSYGLLGLCEANNLMFVRQKLCQCLFSSNVHFIGNFPFVAATFLHYIWHTIFVLNDGCVFSAYHCILFVGCRDFRRTKYRSQFHFIVSKHMCRTLMRTEQ